MTTSRTFRVSVLLASLLTLLLIQPAFAEGETVDIVSLNCDEILIRGGGYTAGQDLLLFARAPQGEGTITDQVTVQANEDGMAPTTTLKFGGQVPDGTYLAVITTPGPGTNEEVTKRFTMRGCMDTADPGTSDEEGQLPFTGDHDKMLMTLGLGLMLTGGFILRLARARG
jgi:hypothetical protein